MFHWASSVITSKDSDGKNIFDAQPENIRCTQMGMSRQRQICHSVAKATNTKNRMNEFYLGPGEKDQAISHSVQAGNELIIHV